MSAPEFPRRALADHDGPDGCDGVGCDGVGCDQCTAGVVTRDAS